MKKYLKMTNWDKLHNFFISNILFHLKIIRFFHSRYHAKIIDDILKNVRKQMFLF